MGQGINGLIYPHWYNRPVKLSAPMILAFGTTFARVCLTLSSLALAARHAPVTSVYRFQAGFRLDRADHRLFGAPSASSRVPSESLKVIKLGKLNLQFTFIGSRTLGKNIQDKTRSIKHTALHQALNIALLRWGQTMVKNDNICLILLDKFPDFFGFTRTTKYLASGFRPRTCDQGLFCAPAESPQFKFFQIVWVIEMGNI